MVDRPMSRTELLKKIKELTNNYEAAYQDVVDLYSYVDIELTRCRKCQRLFHSVYALCHMCGKQTP